MQSRIKKQNRVLNQEKSEVSEMRPVKIDRKFMLFLEELIELLMKKEEQFEEIKIQQTTKVRLKKINKSLLREDRVKMHEVIEKFEDKYDVKV